MSSKIIKLGGQYENPQEKLKQEYAKIFNANNVIVKKHNELLDNHTQLIKSYNYIVGLASHYDNVIKSLLLEALLEAGIERLELYNQLNIDPKKYEDLLKNISILTLDNKVRLIKTESVANIQYGENKEILGGYELVTEDYIKSIIE